MKKGKKKYWQSLRFKFEQTLTLLFLRKNYRNYLLSMYFLPLTRGKLPTVLNSTKRNNKISIKMNMNLNLYNADGCYIEQSKLFPIIHSVFDWFQTAFSFTISNSVTVFKSKSSINSS